MQIEMAQIITRNFNKGRISQIKLLHGKINS
jgi:hypothetical protein